MPAYSTRIVPRSTTAISKDECTRVVTPHVVWSAWALEIAQTFDAPDFCVAGSMGGAWHARDTHQGGVRFTCALRAHVHMSLPA